MVIEAFWPISVVRNDALQLTAQVFKAESADAHGPYFGEHQLTFARDDQLVGDVALAVELHDHGVARAHDVGAWHGDSGRRCEGGRGAGKEIVAERLEVLVCELRLLLD